MKFAKNLQTRALTVAALVALAVLAVPTHAAAQGAADSPSISLASNGSTVWLFDAPTLPVSTLEQLEAGLEEALTDDRGKHVFGERALAEYVKTKRPAAPACLYGQGPCVSAESFAFDALDVNSLQPALTSNQCYALKSWVNGSKNVPKKLAAIKKARTTGLASATERDRKITSARHYAYMNYGFMMRKYFDRKL